MESNSNKCSRAGSEPASDFVGFSFGAAPTAPVANGFSFGAAPTSANNSFLHRPLHRPEGVSFSASNTSSIPISIPNSFLSVQQDPRPSAPTNVTRTALEKIKPDMVDSVLKSMDILVDLTSAYYGTVDDQVDASDSDQFFDFKSSFEIENEKHRNSILNVEPFTLGKLNRYAAWLEREYNKSKQISVLFDEE